MCVCACACVCGFKLLNHKIQTFEFFICILIPDIYFFLSFLCIKNCISLFLPRLRLNVSFLHYFVYIFLNHFFYTFLYIFFFYEFPCIVCTISSLDFTIHIFLYFLVLFSRPFIITHFALYSGSASNHPTSHRLSIVQPSPRHEE